MHYKLHYKISRYKNLTKLQNKYLNFIYKYLANLNLMQYNYYFSFLLY